MTLALKLLSSLMLRNAVPSIAQWRVSSALWECLDLILNRKVGAAAIRNGTQVVLASTIQLAEL